ARRRPGAAPPAPPAIDAAVVSWPHQSGRALEGGARVVQIVFGRRDVEDERLVAELEIARQQPRDLVVAPDQIRTHRVIVLERLEPVWPAVGRPPPRRPRPRPGRTGDPA